MKLPDFIQRYNSDVDVSLLHENIDINKRWRYFTVDKKHIISEYGDIWSSYKKSLMCIQNGVDGYKRIKILGKQIRIHIIVYNSYYDESIDLIPEENLELIVDHADRNKHNNHITNLSLKTLKENRKNCVSKSKHIVCKDIITDEEYIFKSIKEAIDIIQYSTKHGIYGCCNNKLKQHAGCTWQYMTPRKLYEHDIEDTGFKPIMNIDGIDYPNYEINREGVVRKITTRGRIVLTEYVCAGYMTVSLNNRQYRVHRLVAYIFCLDSKIHGRNYVNHLNKDKLDNRACNLEWCTQKENIIHSLGKKVVCINPLTKIINEFKSVSEAAEYYSISQSCISNVCLGVNKTSCNMIWKYIN